MAVTLSPLIKQQFNQGGIPLAGGKLFTYAAGTTTKLATYSNPNGTPNTNPIILDANGQADVWLASGVHYKMVLAPSNDADPPTNQYWSVDGVVNISGSALPIVNISDFTGADATAQLNSAVAYLAGVGGGSILVPAGTFSISATVVVNSSNIAIIGAGSGSSHDVGTSSATSATIFNWTGVAGGTMFRFTSTSGASNQKMSGGGLSGCLLKASGAGVGLDIISWNGGKFSQIFTLEFAVSAINVDVVAALGDAADPQSNKFSNIVCRQYSTTGTCITLDGSATANTSLNTFENIDLLHNGGTGLDVVNADNNIFTRLRCFSSGGAGKPIILRGSNVSSGETARGNIFINYSSNATGVSEGTTSKTFAALGNMFIAADSGNATPQPTIQTGSTLWWSDTNNADWYKSMVLPSVGSTNAEAVAARAGRGSESLMVYNTSENNMLLSDGTRKWSLSVLASGKLRMFQTAGSGNLSLQSTTEITDTTYLGGLPGAESLRAVKVASAVNQLRVSGGTAGNGVIVVVDGTDTNILTFHQNKGIGGWAFTTPAQARYFSVSTNSITNPANYWTAGGTATGTGPTFEATGADAIIHPTISAKGATGAVRIIGDLAVYTAGKGLMVAEGSNAKQGTAVLVAGAVTVSNTAVTANSRIFLTSQVDGGSPGFLRVSARTAATSFTITSSNGADTSTVAYQIFEPA